MLTAIAEANMRPLGSRGTLARAQTKRLLNSERKKEDIPWNLPILRTPLRNWNALAPA